MGFEKITPLVRKIGEKWINVADDVAHKALENGKVYIKMEPSIHTASTPKNLHIENTNISDVFIHTIDQKTLISPRIFPKTMNTGSNIIENYNFFDSFEPYFAEFTDDINPLIMKRIKPQLENKVIHVSNFDRPNGTIAASSRLNETLFTDKIRDCAAIAIVDKTQNLQSLIHCFPAQSSKSNEEIVKYILSHSKPENLEISIIPGINEESGKTISFLVDMVKKYANEAKLNFLNFPRNKMGFRYGDERAILVQNGEIGFCKNFEVGNKIINPKEYITYCQLL